MHKNTTILQCGNLVSPGIPG